MRTGLSSIQAISGELGLVTIDGELVIGDGKSGISCNLRIPVLINGSKNWVVIVIDRPMRAEISQKVCWPSNNLFRVEKLGGEICFCNSKGCCKNGAVLGSISVKPYSCHCSQSFWVEFVICSISIKAIWELGALLGYQRLVHFD